MLKNCLLYSGNSLRLVGSSTKEAGVNIESFTKEAIAGHLALTPFALRKFTVTN